jgi:Flp pilus assembly pilin Flp
MFFARHLRCRAFERIATVKRYFQLAIRFVRDDSAQDLLEYALLAAFVGITGYVVLNSLVPSLAATYASWIDPTTGAPSLWDPPVPAGAGS